jgi:uncharacterized membrane protein
MEKSLVNRRGKKYSAGIKCLLLLGILVFSQWLLGEDGFVFLLWWAAALVLGTGIFPLTSWLFGQFNDKGWLVSKVFGIAAAGFLVWLLVTCGLVPFSASVCVGAAAAVLVICWGIRIVMGRKKKQWLKEWDLLAVFDASLDGELVFVLFFLAWTYLAGFHPAAYGTEKFMDYGFMMAMMRSDTLPAKDMWYAGGTLNYYYGGQYFAVFLTKLTGTQVAQTYNLMRTLVAGFAFSMPFVLVRQMVLDIPCGTKKHRGICALLGGILAGTGVSLAGNMHYVIIGKLVPFIKKILKFPAGEYTYWFPNSTRYIGYYPEGSDKTIHEFPSYSFVLGDLHAHVVNIMFVLAVICLIYAMVKKTRSVKLTSAKKAVKDALLNPYVLVFAFFIGLFHWTNFWDFVIYYVMGGMGVIYCNYLKYREIENVKKRAGVIAGVSALHAVWVYLWGSIFALPFTLRFDTMVNGIALAQNHSRPYQWWMIWGLPVLMTLLFFAAVFWKKRLSRVTLDKSDFFGVILGISALGLILIPEIVYVRDIYEKEYARSNTMFKLTYQAYIMFGIVMGYLFVRMWMEKRHAVRKILTTVGFICFAASCCYIGTAVHSWFGKVWDKEQYQGLDATAFLENDFSEDASAIRWLNENVEGSPVVLEANGDSYTEYERVSAMTGLPTILGWYVHEWLWRGDPGAINERSQEVEAVYTSGSQELIESILKEYDVKYIFVGSTEREKYPELNEVMLQTVGTVVYRDVETNTYILEVNENEGNENEE